MLDFIVPNQRGVLAFQSGFNTQVPRNLEEALWQTLSLKASPRDSIVLHVASHLSRLALLLTGSESRCQDGFHQQPL